MIYCNFNNISNISKQIIRSSLINSFTRSLIKDYKYLSSDVNFLFFTNPSDIQVRDLLKNSSHKFKFKLIVTGKLPNVLKKIFGIKFKKNIDDNIFENFHISEHAKKNSYSESPLKIKYKKLNGMNSTLFERSFQRFDFDNEWNNLNYSSITPKKPYSISYPNIDLKFLQNNVKILSTINYFNESISAYSLIYDSDNFSIFWVNREVGLFDSFECKYIEDFFSSYRHIDLPSLPVVMEIPYGFESASTFRLDCDESVNSSRYLYNFYKSQSIPFSFAITTSSIINNLDINFIKDVDNDNSFIMSHSHSHKEYWGRTTKEMLEEAVISKSHLQGIVNKDITYAVSPFHKINKNTIKALVKANYFGCVGGTVSKNQELQSFRGGISCYDDMFIIINHQVMMHGDCIIKNKSDPLKIYKLSFDLAKFSGGIFGYLDHPFSKRYQYGWLSEYKRKLFHKKLIHYIKSNSSNHLFMSYFECFEFIKNKLDIKILQSNNRYFFNQIKNNKYRYSVKYKDQIYQIENGKCL